MDTRQGHGRWGETIDRLYITDAQWPQIDVARLSFFTGEKVRRPRILIGWFTLRHGAPTCSQWYSKRNCVLMLYCVSKLFHFSLALYLNELVK